MNFDQRFYVQPYKGILLHIGDYSNVGSEAEVMAMMDHAFRWVTSFPRNSVFSITRVEGTHYNVKIVNRARELVQKMGPYIYAEAYVGISPIQRVIFNNVVKLSNRNMRSFESESEAREWLYQSALATLKTPRSILPGSRKAGTG